MNYLVTRQFEKFSERKCSPKGNWDGVSGSPKRFYSGCSRRVLPGTPFDYGLKSIKPPLREFPTADLLKL